MSIRQGNNFIAGTPDVSGKANTDADNFTATGKSTLSEYAMPSNSYVSLTIQASGADYTATDNGWVVADGTAQRNGGNISVSNKSAGLTINSSTGLNNTWGLNAAAPVKAGDTFTVYYNDATVSSLKFIYAQGEI